MSLAPSCTDFAALTCSIEIVRSIEHHLNHFGCPDLCIPSWRVQAQREAQLDLILSEPSLDATTPATNLKNHSRADD